MLTLVLGNTISPTLEKSNAKYIVKYDEGVIEIPSEKIRHEFDFRIQRYEVITKFREFDSFTQQKLLRIYESYNLPKNVQRYSIIHNIILNGFLVGFISYIASLLTNDEVELLSKTGDEFIHHWGDLIPDNKFDSNNSDDSHNENTDSTESLGDHIKFERVNEQPRKFNYKNFESSVSSDLSIYDNASGLGDLLDFGGDKSILIDTMAKPW